MYILVTTSTFIYLKQVHFSIAGMTRTSQIKNQFIN